MEASVSEESSSTSSRGSQVITQKHSSEQLKQMWASVMTDPALFLHSQHYKDNELQLTSMMFKAIFRMFSATKKNLEHTESQKQQVECDMKELAAKKCEKCIHWEKECQKWKKKFHGLLDCAKSIQRFAELSKSEDEVTSETWTKFTQMVDESSEEETDNTKLPSSKRELKTSPGEKKTQSKRPKSSSDDNGVKSQISEKKVKPVRSLSLKRRTPMQKKEQRSPEKSLLSVISENRASKNCDKKQMEGIEKISLTDTDNKSPSLLSSLASNNSHGSKTKNEVIATRSEPITTRYLSVKKDSKLKQITIGDTAFFAKKNIVNMQDREGHKHQPGPSVVDVKSETESDTDSVQGLNLDETCLPENMEITSNVQKENDKSKDLLSTMDFVARYALVPSKVSNSPKHKYKHGAIRKKSERKKLEGFECDECKKYFEMVCNGNDQEKKARLNKCSRHRARYEYKSYTPPGFWDPDFPEKPQKQTAETEND